MQFEIVFIIILVYIKMEGQVNNSNQKISGQLSENLNRLGFVEFLELQRIQIERNLIQNDELYLDDRIPQFVLRKVKPYCEICCEDRIQQMANFCCYKHQYCSTCIHQVIKENISSFKTIKCPDQSCPVQFNQKSPYFKSMPEADKIKFSQIVKVHNMLADPTQRQCSRLNCQGKLFIQADSVYCRLCKQEYCFKCLQILKNKKCDCSTAKRLEKRLGFRRCPRCKMVVQKSQGCNHMTCYCKYQFCYNCGQPYKNNVDGHLCQQNQDQSLPFLLKMEANVLNSASSYNNIISAASLLRTVRLNDQGMTCLNFAAFVLGTVTLYPLFALGMSFFVIIFPFILVASFILIMVPVLVFIVPLGEICNLKLPVSKCLGNYFPSCVLRCLIIPLYPIYLISGIIDGLPRQLRSFKNSMVNAITGIPTTIAFCIMLPCLAMLKQQAS